MQTFMAMDRGRRSQTNVPELGINPNNVLLVEALSQMTGGKCAFCEAKDMLTTHRFRPPGNALPLAGRKEAHLFYVWLADAWHNLFPICLGCRPIEPFFPVDGPRYNLPSSKQIDKYLSGGTGIWPYACSEKNQLIDPTRESRFDAHFKPKLDGTLIALNPRAAMTMEVFDLNREDRQQQRATTYKTNLATLKRLVGNLRPVRKPPSTPDAFDELFGFDRMEFGGTWLLLLKRLAVHIDLPEGPIGLRRRQLKDGFRRLAAAADGVERLNQAIAAVVREDPALRSAGTGPKRIHRVRAQLRSVDVANFKSIERLTLELPAPLVTAERVVQRTPSLVILGENATGKSSLLEAIALALATEEARRFIDIDWPSIPLDPKQMGSSETHGTLEARVRLEFDSGQTATLSIGEQGSRVRTEFGSERVAVFAYGAFRRFASEYAGAPSSRHIKNLFDASPLANPEPWLKSLAPETFDMVVRTLRDLLSIEGDFDVIQRVGPSRQLQMVTALIQPDGTPRYNRTPLHAVSSGYRSMLGMLCDILRGLWDENVDADFSFGTSRGVVLIDEIEAHLHPRWKVQVMESLRKALPGMTFIVTTHDPLCLRGMGSGEVIVLQRVAASDAGVSSTLPITVEQMTGLPDAADLTLEQLLTSDFFQMFSTNDAVIDRKMARIGDLTRRRAAKEELSPEDRRVLDEFERDIASALPVGSTEVHRLVQEAVANYLEKRREASSVTLARLSEKTKADILKALETL
ncbi:AAA family ATPase [Ensifer sp. ENS03]|uniref:AAA family ATPase n=1 Tax=Ensifer sp. ENS03 TaxID=2769283 RepID=UPI001AEE5C8C|nr:AAA family ATPase [Ensifer sp. ENS03]